MAHSESSRREELLGILRERFPTVEGEQPHEPSDFMHEFGSVAHALLYAALFVPEFCIVDDSVILNDDSSKPIEFRKKKQISTMIVGELEQSFNWREIPFLFAKREGSEREDALLADYISDAWQIRLTALFPHRRFAVRVLSSSETGGCIGVGFREIRG